MFYKPNVSTRLVPVVLTISCDLACDQDFSGRRGLIMRALS